MSKDADGVARADEALFRPVRAGNPFEETVERLLQAIKLGVVAPGDRLPSERDLAARLNVSRVTLREAIRALTEAGYVESRRGRYGGTFVNDRLPKPSRVGPRGWPGSSAAGSKTPSYCAPRWSRAPPKPPLPGAECESKTTSPASPTPRRPS